MHPAKDALAASHLRAGCHAASRAIASARKSMEQCPKCGGRRLLLTREERDHLLGGVVYTGSVSVVVCKTCRAVFRDPKDDAAFIQAVERFTADELLATEAKPRPRDRHKIERRSAAPRGLLPADARFPPKRRGARQVGPKVAETPKARRPKSIPAPGGRPIRSR